MTLLVVPVALQSSPMTVAAAPAEPLLNLVTLTIRMSTPPPPPVMVTAVLMAVPRAPQMLLAARARPQPAPGPLATRPAAPAAAALVAPVAAQAVEHSKPALALGVVAVASPGQLPR